MLNRYFVDHPHMVLGEVTAQSTQYSREDYTVVSRPGTTLGDLLSQAIQYIHGTYQPVQVEELDSQEESTETIPADPSVSNYSYAIVDGQVYMRENSVMQRVEVSQGVKERIQGMVQLRDLVRRLMDDQLEDREDEVIQARQRELEDVYDRFTQKYGLLNARANAKAFSQDASYYLLCSLENLDENGQLKSKADMFYQRTIRPHRTVTRVETPSEALAVCMGERGKVDLPYMAQLLGLGDTQSVAQELQGVIFAVPGQQEEDGSPHYVTADEYLSGNVREKLRQAEQAAEEREEYRVNVEALRQAQPKDLTASEIDVRLGATWLDKKYIQQFMEHTFEPPSYVRNLIQVDFSPYTAEWQISGKNAVGYNDVAASAMESKRLGLCHKSMFAVPNHLTLQWANEFLRLYPGANLLVASKKDFETARRKKFCARIATGDYDAVIIGQSQFEKIPISPERQARMLREQIQEIEDAIGELKRGRGEHFTVKQMEKTRKTLQNRLEKLVNTERKDDVITFEQLGVDRLFVDESQAYKNLFVYTKMRNVAGLSTSESQRSSDMFTKCRYMDELTGGRGVIFASGTPVSNSMTELYNVMRYLQYDTLKEKGLLHFDAWASTFGETTTAIELAPEGTGVPGQDPVCQIL